jgi:hypothetical protein
MTVTVPSTDIGNFQLQARVTAMQAAVTANANPLIQPQLVAQLDQLQQQLVNSLTANGNSRTPGAGSTGGPKPSYLTASGILSSGTINT